jgi:hypothetical protein
VPVTDFFGSVSSIQPTPALNSTAGESSSVSDSHASRAAQELDARPPAAASSAGRDISSRGNWSGPSDCSCGAELSAVAVGPVEGWPSSVVGPGVYLGMAAVASMVAVASVAAARIVAPQLQ